MNDKLNKVLTPQAAAENEWVAGVPRSAIFEGAYWTGFRQANESEMFKMISENLHFRPRNNELEKDETFKQIIPYFLVRNESKFFTSVRKNKAGDSRIHGYRLIGFGGHLRKEDIAGEMREWLIREFREEIDTKEIKDITFIGIVNDDSNAVDGIGKVHFGLVFVVDIGAEASLIETDKFENGQFMELSELKQRVNEMESWSKLVVEQL